jgi:hypothetical protein
MRRIVMGLAAVLAASVGLATTAPAGPTTAGTTPEITASGVGLVKVGKTYVRARRQNLIGKIRPGCPLAPNTRSARLKSPLRGTVDFTRSRTRRIENITILGGASARGIGIGATLAELQNEFARATVDRNTEEVFGIWLVKVPRSDGGPMQFAVDAQTEKVTSIGVPFLAFCE